MCAIVGITIKGITSEQEIHVDRLIREARIRGKHATGVSYIQKGVLKSIKEPIPADEFMNKYTLDHFMDIDGWKRDLTMILHCRYSTSDLQYNQPFYNNSLSVIHNGVISQELPENWESLYGYKCETKNDSELLFHTVNAGKSPLKVWHESSIAAIELYPNRNIRFYRNGRRPLHLTAVHNGYIITSTKDIVERAKFDIKDHNKVPAGAYCTLDEHFAMITEESGVNINDLQ